MHTVLYGVNISRSDASQYWAQSTGAESPPAHIHTHAHNNVYVRPRKRDLNDHLSVLYALIHTLSHTCIAYVITIAPECRVQNQYIALCRTHTRPHARSVPCRCGRVASCPIRRAPHATADSNNNAVFALFRGRQMMRLVSGARVWRDCLWRVGVANATGRSSRRLN